ncbi:MAG: hypothetical protein KDA89_12165 [Planctomycetaceae bacterium]|nr:hypothetical protein [Planctomycetaceae bacterium]
MTGNDRVGQPSEDSLSGQRAVSESRPQSTAKEHPAVTEQPALTEQPTETEPPAEPLNIGFIAACVLLPIGWGVLVHLVFRRFRTVSRNRRPEAPAGTDYQI